MTHGQVLETEANKPAKFAEAMAKRSYLDLDRAAPSETRPGRDRHITHQTEYLSVEWEGLENEVRGSSEK
jgi:hypothetical protein